MDQALVRHRVLPRHASQRYSAHEPAEDIVAALEPKYAAQVGLAADEPSSQPLERLFGDAQALAAACQHAVPGEAAEMHLAARDQGPAAHAPKAAALYNPKLQDFDEGLHRHGLANEAAEPAELDLLDAECIYAALEDQQLQGERAGDAEAEEGTARPGTAAYYHAHKHDSVYAGAKLNLEQTCYTMLTQKQAHRQHDTAFGEQCRLQRDVMYPQPNKVPGSLYLMRKVRSALLSLSTGCQLQWTATACDTHMQDSLIIFGARGGLLITGVAQD